MSKTSLQFARSDIIKWIITCVLSAIFLLVPEQGLYTHQVKFFLAVTVFGLSLAAFEIVPVMFISVIMPGLWILLGVAPAETVMSPWVGTTFLMIMGALFMAATLEDCGLLKRVAYLLMCKVKNSYFALLTSIMFVGIIINILTSGRGYLIIAPLATGLCVSLKGMNKRLGAGLATAVMLGGCTSHAYTYQATAWAVLLRLGADYIGPTDITPLGIIMHNWPLLIVSLVILFIISKCYTPEEGLGEVTYFKENLAAMGPITRKEKSNLLMLVLVLIYIFTINIHQLDINLGFALLPWIVFLPFLNGADTNTLQKMNFQIIFFVAACMSIGTVASSLGFGSAIASLCAQLLNGSTSPFAISGIIFSVVFLLNFLMTPMAIFALIIEPILILVTDMGYSAIPFAYAINACSEAILLPYEYVPYLIVYSFGMISMKDFIKVNIIRSVIFFSGFLILLVPYWMLIGLL